MRPVTTGETEAFNNWLTVVDRCEYRKNAGGFTFMGDHPHDELSLLLTVMVPDTGGQGLMAITTRIGVYLDDDPMVRVRELVTLWVTHEALEHLWLADSDEPDAGASRPFEDELRRDHGAAA